MSASPSVPRNVAAPSVDVAMITYNHEAYLAEAIEGVLRQQTTFPVRMVIGEDYSTDRTREILLQYQQRYPDRFLLLLPEKNIGVMPNLKQVLEACTAPYIALLEGDDYWMNPHKLQRQVDFLQAHPEHSMTLHDAEIFWQDGATPPVSFSSTKTQLQQGERDFTHADVVKNGWFMPTASLVFRREPVAKLPEWFTTVFSGDYSLHLLISRAGKVHYFPEVMSRYRMHSAGLSHNQTMNRPDQIIKKVQENEAFRQHFDAEHRAHFTRSISDLQVQHGTALRRQGQYGGMTKSWLAAIATDPVRVARNFVGKLIRGQLF
ncbi:glycosyltransferase [Hymenobacter lutimineralis]|uniref:Glycosyltransferase n=1 Tax=Hymenobacter lutimineralis TaxID=2606448 RepID=A0A5D6V998_9BACT|nr:glycosyltransferase [Hymenobacter lutimineralis]TYZ11920.1 glycosyltransferase [Hymenobacter lutimineralis]